MKLPEGGARAAAADYGYGDTSVPTLHYGYQLPTQESTALHYSNDLTTYYGYTIQRAITYATGALASSYLTLPAKPLHCRL